MLRAVPFVFHHPILVGSPLVSSQTPDLFRS
jgi:hypothetical protein